MTSLRHELASLLVGYDVERLRRENDAFIVLVDTAQHEVAAFCQLAKAHKFTTLEWLLGRSAGRMAYAIDSLPVGAVARARERLGVK